MNQLRTVEVALALLTLGTSSADERWVVRADGAGPIRIGMTLDRLNQALEETQVQKAKTKQIVTTKV